MKTQLKATDIENLPPAISVTQAGQILGLGRSQAYAAVARGDIDAIRIGERSLIVPTIPFVRKFRLDGSS